MSMLDHDDPYGHRKEGEVTPQHPTHQSTEPRPKWQPHSTNPAIPTPAPSLSSAPAPEVLAWLRENKLQKMVACMDEDVSLQELAELTDEELQGWMEELTHVKFPTKARFRRKVRELRQKLEKVKRTDKPLAFIPITDKEHLLKEGLRMTIQHMNDVKSGLPQRMASHITKLTENRNSVKVQVEDEFEKLRDMICSAETALLKRLDEIYAEKKAKIEKVNTDVMEYCEELNNGMRQYHTITANSFVDINARQLQIEALVAPLLAKAQNSDASWNAQEFDDFIIYHSKMDEIKNFTFIFGQFLDSLNECKDQTEAAESTIDTDTDTQSQAEEKASEEKQPMSPAGPPPASPSPSPAAPPPPDLSSKHINELSLEEILLLCRDLCEEDWCEESDTLEDIKKLLTKSPVNKSPPNPNNDKTNAKKRERKKSSGFWGLFGRTSDETPDSDEEVSNSEPRNLLSPSVVSPDDLKSSDTPGAIIPQKLKAYIAGDTLDLSNGAFHQLSDEMKSKLQEYFQCQKVLVVSRDKFPRVAPILAHIRKIKLDSNGTSFGEEGMLWVSEIVTSKHSAIVSVSMEHGCGINDPCLALFSSQFREGSQYVKSPRELALKKVMITCDTCSSKVQNQWKQDLLKYSQVNEIRINNMLYRVNRDRKDRPVWVFVLYVLQDF